jgi:hypothetical protein
LARPLLFFLACAPALLGAQQPPQPPPPRADSAVRADTIPRPAIPDSVLPVADTTKKKPPADTAKGAHWDREAIFASGALTVADLLEQVPGVTMMTTGFILAPKVASWYGDPGRVRIYIDGIELDAINVRNGGINDLATIPLWSLEDVFVERSAGGLRVHLTTWRVDRTTPDTRADIMTGSENINLYRGFFGVRLSNGGVIQLAGQQFSTISTPGMDGQSLAGMVRIGWAGKSWSFDGTLIHQGLDRNAGERFPVTAPEANALPAFHGNESVAYVRAAWRDPQSDGPWAQFIAATINAGEHNDSSTSALSTFGTGITPTTVSDTVDTMAVRSQYIASAGFTRWGLRLSGTGRLRSIGRKAYFTPSARLEYDSHFLTVSGYAERGIDSTTRTDVLGRITPVPWLSLSGAVSLAAPAHADLGPTATSTRVEGAIGWHDRWLSGGIITRSATLIAPPIELDTALRPVNAPAATGIVVAFRGPFVFGFGLDADATQWNAVGPYLPQTQARTRISFESSFLHRFPRNNFHLSASAWYEYRSTMYVPLGTNPFGQSAPGYSALSSLIEIRIGNAIISWKNQNFLGTVYYTYPGYLMPRLTNVYGVRWQFWN